MHEARTLSKEITKTVLFSLHRTHISCIVIMFNLLENFINYSDKSFTKSSKMSLWWTWIVTRVSNLTLSTFVRSCVV